MTQLKTDPAPPPPPRPPDSEERRSGVVGLVALVAGIVALGIWTRASLVIVILAIIFMVFLHELGHYLTAKWAGMKVTEFFIGFGPRIWSFRRGETEYGIKAIPAGAYVRVIGMHNLEEVPPEDEPRTYRQKSYPRRLSVAVAGSAMHFLMALACIYTLLVLEPQPNGRLFEPTPAEELTNWIVGAVSEDSAAEAAGIAPGDRIVAVDGVSVDSFGALRDEVKTRAGQEVVLILERDGQRTELTTTIGRREDDPTVGFLGVGPEFPFEEVDYGPLDAIPQTFEEFSSVTTESVKALFRFFSPTGIANFVDDVAQGGDDDAVEPGSGSGGGSDVDTDRVVSILGATRLGADATERGFAGLLFFMVLINIFVGIFNLVPLLPLDGGHVAIATYERLRSRRGRPYHADVAKLLPITYVVVLLLIALGVTTMYLDIVNPVNIE